MNSLNMNFDEIVNFYEEHLINVRRRLVYMKPNEYSDESLAVGVLVRHELGCEFSYVASEAAYTALGCLYGIEAKEQLIYGLDVLRRRIYSGSDIFETGNSPTSLLKFSSIDHVTCSNPKTYASDFLKISSSLYRNYDCMQGSSDYVGQDTIKLDLYKRASLLDAIKATKIFEGRKFDLLSKGKVEIPIYGEKIFGAPISFVTKRVSTAKVQAEAYIAKFNYVKQILNHQSAALYILMPTLDKDINHKIVKSSIDELYEIAKANDVILRCEKDPNELAHIILNDEVA